MYTVSGPDGRIIPAHTYHDALDFARSLSTPNESGHIQCGGTVVGFAYPDREFTASVAQIERDITACERNARTTTNPHQLAAWTLSAALLRLHVAYALTDQARRQEEAERLDLPAFLDARAAEPMPEELGEADYA